MTQAGYPIWHGNVPRLVQAFIRDYDLKGKTVIPFCTSGGSGISGSMEAIRAAAKGAVVTKDVPDNCVVGGVPAKIIKDIENDVEE